MVQRSGQLSQYSDMLRAGRCGDRIPVGGEIFRKRPKQPWSPHSLLYNRHRVIPGGVKRWGFGVNHLSPSSKNKKVKCTLVQALRLCTGRTAHRESSGIALLFHDHGTRRGWGVSLTLLPLFTPRKDPVPILQEARWAPGPVWTGAENLAPTGIRSRTVQPVASRYTDWDTGPTIPIWRRG